MTKNIRQLGFATQAVHAGERAARPDFTPTVTPIYQSVSYGYDQMATLDAVVYKERLGFIYYRFSVNQDTLYLIDVVHIERPKPNYFNVTHLNPIPLTPPSPY